MLLGKVIGTVVSCVVYEGLESWPMRLVQPLDKRRRPKGSVIVCADSTRMAAAGELIYFEGGREAAMALEPWFVPVDHSIIGIVDQLTVDGETVSEPPSPEANNPKPKKGAAAASAAAKKTRPIKRAAKAKKVGSGKRAGKSASKPGGRK